MTFILKLHFVSVSCPRFGGGLSERRRSRGQVQPGPKRDRGSPEQQHLCEFIPGGMLLNMFVVNKTSRCETVSLKAAEASASLQDIFLSGSGWSVRPTAVIGSREAAGKPAGGSSSAPRYESMPRC